jgi:hypothetical protein
LKSDYLQHQIFFYSIALVMHTAAKVYIVVDFEFVTGSKSAYAGVAGFPIGTKKLY